MCIGEKRRIRLPPSMGFAMKKRFENINIGNNIIKNVVVNKNQPLILEVKLLSINGVA